MTAPTERHGYDIDDPGKIQGRDEIVPASRDLATMRLTRALNAIGDVDGRLLLLGAGAGRYARALAAARPDLDVVASDLSQRAIAEARSIGGPPVYLIADAQALPHPDNAFNAVVFFDLLEHVPQPDVLLRECWRVLGDDGVLHFFVPLENEPMTLYRALKNDAPIPIHRWKHEHVGHVQRYTQADVLALVWRAGLRAEHIDHSFHLVGQIHDIVDYWHRERRRGGEGRLPLPLVHLVTRGVFLVTWRLAYLEDHFYSGRRFASGLHVTARRPSR